MVAGNTDSEVFTQASDAWDHLARVVEAYVASLDDANMVTHVPAWDMFKDELRARGLAPWAQAELMDGPDGLTWGVEETRHERDLRGY